MENIMYSALLVRIRANCFPSPFTPKTLAWVKLNMLPLEMKKFCLVHQYSQSTATMCKTSRQYTWMKEISQTLTHQLKQIDDTHIYFSGSLIELCIPSFLSSNEKIHARDMLEMHRGSSGSRLIWELHSSTFPWLHLEWLNSTKT